MEKDKRFYAVVKWLTKKGPAKFLPAITNNEKCPYTKVIKRCPTWKIAEREAAKLQKQAEA